MNTSLLNLGERFEGCIIGGTIGDARGSGYENASLQSNPENYYWGGYKKEQIPEWAITDDTQLTLATCEALAEYATVTPEILSGYFLKYYKQKKLTGIGASTLKALRELEIGGHWSQVGRTGEYAAGNGAAMRIAPFAFKQTIGRNEIRDFCRITHKNDEAYVGALAVVLAIRAIINKEWNDNANLLQLIIPQLPDTKVKDRLVEIAQRADSKTISEVAKSGNSGYVVDSVPFAIFSASQVKYLDFNTILSEVIKSGGDTDTNASITGQIAGSYVGIDNIPIELKQKLMGLRDYEWINDIVDKTKRTLEN